MDPTFILLKGLRSNRPVLFEIENVNVRSGETFLFAGRGLSLQVRKGDRICIKGASGMGKTR